MLNSRYPRLYSSIWVLLGAGLTSPMLKAADNNPTSIISNSNPQNTTSASATTTSTNSINNNSTANNSADSNTTAPSGVSTIPVDLSTNNQNQHTQQVNGQSSTDKNLTTSPAAVAHNAQTSASQASTTPAQGSSSTASTVSGTSAPSSAAADSSASIAAKSSPSFFTRVHNAIFFWRKPKHDADEDLIPAEPTITVKVKGAPDVLAHNLIATLQQVTIADFADDFQDNLPRFRSLATDASQAVGYYTATFHFSKVNKDTLLVEVTPDVPVKVTSQKITITGDATTDKSFIKLQEEPDLKVGDPLNHGAYETTKNRILNLATDHGYFKGHFLAHDVTVTLPDKTADINVAYDSGVRYHFGPVIYKNSKANRKLPVKLKVLQQLQPFQPGQPYDANQLAKFSRNLLDTRFFNNVQVDAPTPDAPTDDLPSPSQPGDTQSASSAPNTTTGTASPPSASTDSTSTPAVDHKSDTTPVSSTSTTTSANDKQATAATNAQSTSTSDAASTSSKPASTDAAKSGDPLSIPVVVQLNADQPNSTGVGVGYGTDTGPRIRTQYRRALVNDLGDSFEADGELSTVDRSLDLRYNIPIDNPLTDVVSIFGGYENQDVAETNGLEVDTKTETVGVQRTINPVGEWQRTYSLRYRVDQLENNALDINPILLPPPFNVEGISTTQQALLAGFGLNKLETVGGVNPTSGFRQYYQVDVAGKNILSDANMVILHAGLHAMQTFAEKHQIIVSTDLGTIITPNFSLVPYNLRFFAGGDQSIRGYDYKSLSTLVNGYEIGGQNLAISSVEYNYEFQPKWRAAVFVDAGNAFDRKFTDPIKVGTGFGVRWASPVGPVRIDLAAGISESSPPIRLVFYIGQPL